MSSKRTPLKPQRQ